LGTSNLYRDGLWKKIVSHPDFDIGRREFEALVRFLPILAQQLVSPTNILHLGVGDGREIKHFANTLALKQYVINDICAASLAQVIAEARAAHPNISFSELCADIECSGVLAHARSGLIGQTLFVLVGNTSIWSNKNLDKEIALAMRPGDTLLVTAEMPHPDMFASYIIEPVYDLLGSGGVQINRENARTWYDMSDQCLKIAFNNQTLFASYKPTKKQFLDRLSKVSLFPQCSERYDDIHMLAGLFSF